MEAIQVLIMDLGSQYTSLIERSIRELGVRSIILPSTQVVHWLSSNQPRAVILSGGSASVKEKDAPVIPPRILESRTTPILGICYGIQWLTWMLGGEVFSERGEKEYGLSQVRAVVSDPLFVGLPEYQEVWMSHGDSVAKVPPGFQAIASAVGGEGIAAMSNPQENVWGVLFHPEVRETTNGREILANFLFSICGCQRDWETSDFVKEVQTEVLASTQGARVIGGFSGGVDSCTLFALLLPILGSQLKGVCIDGGQLREGELQEVKGHAETLGVDLLVIEASKRFQEALQDVSDAETKRRVFSRIYTQLLEEAAAEFGASFLLQGSLAPDYIESGKEGTAVLIKPHHNVGLTTTLQELHPFRKLFKYEVRALARELGLPEAIAEREPFPGPGLFIRIVGDPPTPERLEIVRWADREVREILREHATKEYSQLVVGLLCTPTVGVKGDARVYGPSVVVRAVRTTDFMTGTGVQLPEEARRMITSRVTKHPGVVRVFFDETNKPPATIELE